MTSHINDLEGELRPTNGGSNKDKQVQIES